MKVQRLCIHPIKSLRGIDVDRIAFSPTGLLNDRRMMLVNAQNHFVSQREFPQLAQIQVNALDASCFELVFPSGLRQIVPFHHEGNITEAYVWNDQVSVIHSSLHISELFSDFLHQHIALVYMHDATPRWSDHQHIKQSLTDSCPILVTTSGSIEQLEQIAHMSIDSRRFRGNIHIDSDVAGEEGDWKYFVINELKFHAIKRCSRCVVVNNDPTTGERNHFVLKSLVDQSGEEKKARFGLYCHGPENGSIAVGDEVIAIRRNG